MSGFLSIPGPSLDPPAPPPPSIEHDGWYPPTDLAHLRASMRIDDNVTPQRLADAAIAGMLSLERELASWRALQTAESLAVVSDREFAGEKRLVLLYRRAVYSYAAAELAETHRDLSATSAGTDRGEQKALSADEHRRNATHAVRDILNQPRTAVELL